MLAATVCELVVEVCMEHVIAYPSQLWLSRPNLLTEGERRSCSKGNCSRYFSYLVVVIAPYCRQQAQQLNYLFLEMIFFVVINVAHARAMFISQQADVLHDKSVDN